jgi:hypothetical protein
MDPLQNSAAQALCGSRWAERRRFAVNSPAIGKKNNAADRSSRRKQRPQGVMQRTPDTPRFVLFCNLLIKINRRGAQSAETIFLRSVFVATGAGHPKDKK